MGWRLRVNEFLLRTTRFSKVYSPIQQIWRNRVAGKFDTLIGRTKYFINNRPRIIRILIEQNARLQCFLHKLKHPEKSPPPPMKIKPTQPPISDVVSKITSQRKAETKTATKSTESASTERPTAIVTKTNTSEGKEVALNEEDSLVVSSIDTREAMLRTKALQKPQAGLETQAIHMQNTQKAIVSSPLASLPPPSPSPPLPSLPTPLPIPFPPRSPPTPLPTVSKSSGVKEAPVSSPSTPPDPLEIEITSRLRRSTGKSLVENPYYRRMNLAQNNIYLRSRQEQLPVFIANLVTQISRYRDPLDPIMDHLQHNVILEELSFGASETRLERFLQSRIFPDCKSGDSLDRSDRQPMTKRAVPNTGSLKVSNPVPDMLYGYNPENAFPEQQDQLISLGVEVIANNQDLVFPFLVVEFKGDGPSITGSLWVATNQCLGGSSSCIKITECLNAQLRKHKIRPIDSVVFSIAIRGTEARLFVTWKHNQNDYYMANFASYLLQDPVHYRRFRDQVHNIIDWGRKKRLQQIQHRLDKLLECEV